MTEAKVTVTSSVGLHARPAALFVQECQKRKSRVVVESCGRKADGKSILQVLALGVKCGQQILIRADGVDEAETLDALLALVKNAV